MEEKQNLLRMGSNAVLKHKRLSLLRNILLQNIIYYPLDSKKRSVENNENINFSQNTKNNVLNYIWK